MFKFRRGDIVTGTEEADANYGITTSAGTYKVIKAPIFRKWILGKILNHSITSCVGHEYTVNPKYFRIIKETKVKEL